MNTRPKGNDDSIAELNQIISDSLSNVINNDYIFLDLPYYTNIGDILIWKGTEDFLSKLPYKCLYKSSIETYTTPKISKNVIIILQGGGNFGDIWRRHTAFCLRILEEFPDNRVIILPQSVYYKDTRTLSIDAQLMAKHKDLTICARDSRTYKLLKAHFSNNSIIQVPDMAFCISASYLQKNKVSEKDKALFLKRKDVEFALYNYQQYIKHTKIEELEWPSMEHKLLISKILSILVRIQAHSRAFGFSFFMKRVVDLYAQKVFMPMLLKIGIRFISGYNYVYSTRLHGAVLSILLGKSLTFFDNSYGKNSTFYETWLKNWGNIQFIEKE